MVCLSADLFVSNFKGFSSLSIMVTEGEMYDAHEKEMKSSDLAVLQIPPN